MSSFHLIFPFPKIVLKIIYFAVFNYILKYAITACGNAEGIYLNNIVVAILKFKINFKGFLMWKCLFNGWLLLQQEDKIFLTNYDIISNYFPLKSKKLEIMEYKKLLFFTSPHNKYGL